MSDYGDKLAGVCHSSDKLYTQDEVNKMMAEQQAIRCKDIEEAVSKYRPYERKYRAAILLLKEMIGDEYSG